MATIMSFKDLVSISFLLCSTFHCVDFILSLHIHPAAQVSSFVNIKLLLQFRLCILLSWEEGTLLFLRCLSFFSLGLTGYVHVAEFPRCIGNVDGIRQSGPVELEVEVLTQNPCLRMGRGGFPKDIWDCVTRREMGVGNQTIDVYKCGFRPRTLYGPRVR